MELVQIVRSGGAARCDDVVLRETSTTRLVFRAVLVDNAKDAAQPVRGWIVSQRKRKGDEWEDHNEVALSNMRAGEWVKTELRAEEVDKLVRHVGGLYRLYRSGGLPSGKTHFLKLDLQAGESPEDLEGTVRTLLALGRRSGLDTFGKVVDLTLRDEDSAEVVRQLERLEVSTVQKLQSLAGVAALRAALDTWEANEGNTSEEFWQQTFKDNAFILSQAFSVPVLLIQDKAYVGGRELSREGATELDFLYANPITANAACVEIKTPATPLLGTPYRGKSGGRVYGASVELSGALAQVRNYRYRLTTGYSHLRIEREGEFEVAAPRCLIVAGHAGCSLGDDDAKKRSFEALRGGLADIDVITYDELFERVRSLCCLLEGT
ncbi:hypothetical protein BSZ37_07675 [Rubrivirga marina]|uniref:DUF4263 domain-containing protein n=1 Tax=Rubrivirga marina TaxID=1196024 RepID=A0A271IYX1_9BACT|nr:hypothetical protein BSZ37_07675 [Rubrivirga marina]